ncbi:hypothetical protein [Ruminococcus flavefaciens]|nr:hypothetical protein [Ruminococcus flavefaciens]
MYKRFDTILYAYNNNNEVSDMHFGNYSIVKILFFFDSIDEENAFEPENV